MQRADLEALCEPLTPEDALSGLQELYEALEASAWGQAEDLESANAGIEVLKKVIEETKADNQPPSVRTISTLSW